MPLLRSRFCAPLYGVSLVALVSSSSALAQTIIDSGQTVTVPGSQSSPWDIVGDLLVGASGSGALEITSGGTVSSDGGAIGGSAGGPGVVTVSGADSQWSNSDLFVGWFGNGALDIAEGGTVSSDTGAIGVNPGVTGAATVSGAGSQWNASSDLTVGRSGAGTLEITDGGAVSNVFGYIGLFSGGIGAVTVSGAGSQWNNSSDLYVGYAGNGALEITGGGGVTTNGFGYVGLNSGSVGEVTVSGAGSQWNSSISLFVGNEGNGTLEIINGGSASDDFGFIGAGPGGSGRVTVRGEGSQWNNTIGLYVGSSGNGTMEITDGGDVSSDFAIIGSNSGGTGTVTVSGAGSQWVNPSGLVVGDAGDGVMRITDGGAVSSGGGSIGTLSGGTGWATVSGADSQWNNSSSLRVGNGGNGTLEIAEGGSVTSIDSSIGTLSGGIGTVTVSGAGSQWNNSSGLAVGDAGNGTLKISDQGNVTASNVILASAEGSSGVMAIGAMPSFEPAAPGTLITSTLQFGEGDGRIVFNHTALDYVFDATINGGADNAAGSGTGLVGDGLIEAIAGRTILNADHGDFTGTLQASGGGILQVNGDMSHSVAAVLAGGRLEGYGSVGAATNAGVIAPGASIGTLTIEGDYTGAGGTIEIETVLDGDGSPTDLLVITGATSGQTNVEVTNLDGGGGQTVEGIRIISVGGASNGQFSLVSDFVTEDGQQAVIGGAYAYTLHQNGIADPGDGDWYLRSALREARRFQPNAPLYEAYPQVLLALNGLPTLQQRVGNRYWSGAAAAAGVSTDGGPADNPVDGNSVWTRIEGSHARFEPGVSTSSTGYDIDLIKLQAGLDGQFYESAAGHVIGGITVHYGHGSADVSSLFGDGSIDTDGYGFGGTLTWYGANGLYIDGQAQLTWYDSDITSRAQDITVPGLVKSNDGFGYALSIEGGQRIALGYDWSLTPQAQLVYSAVDFDDFVDPYDTRVGFVRGAGLLARAGLALDKEASWQDVNGQIARSHVYGIANLYGEFLDGSRVNVAGVGFDSRNDRIWGGIGAGGSYNWGNDRYSLYAEGTIDTSLENFADSYALKASVGFRMSF